jgi:hypothetical protein
MIFMDVFSYLLLLFALIDHVPIFSHFPWERSEKKTGLLGLTWHLGSLHGQSCLESVSSGSLGSLEMAELREPVLSHNIYMYIHIYIYIYTYTYTYIYTHVYIMLKSIDGQLIYIYTCRWLININTLQLYTLSIG